MIPSPAIGASMAASAVLTTSREWIATDEGDLPVVKIQALGDINPSKVTQLCVPSSPGLFGVLCAAK